MKLITHIVLKDLRRFWPLITITVVAILYRTLDVFVGFGGLDPVFEKLTGVLIVTLKWPLIFLLCVAVVQEDGVRGTTSFWMTRPIRPLSLFAAKFIFCVLTTGLPSFLATAAVAASFGTDLPTAGIIGFEVFSATVAVAILALLMGALTNTILQACMVVVSAAIVGAFFALQWNFGGSPWIGQLLPLPSATADTRTQLVVSIGLIVLVAPIVAIQQFVGRNSFKTLAVFGTAVIAGLFIVRQFPVSLVGEPTSVPVESKTLPDQPAQVSMQAAGEAETRGIYSQYNPQTRQRELFGYVQLPVLAGVEPADRLIEAVTVESTLTLPDGTVRKYRPVSGGPNLGYSLVVGAMFNSLGIDRRVARRTDADIGRLNVFGITKDEDPAPPSAPARLSAKIRLRELVFRRELSLPLREGAFTARGGELFQIHGITRHPDGRVEVRYRFVRATSMLRPEGKARPDGESTLSNATTGLVLVNRRRGEIAPAYPIRDSERVTGVFTEKSALRTFSRTYRSGSTVSDRGIDDEWLSDAELELYVSRPVRYFHHTLEVDNFILSRRAAAPDFWN